MPLTTTVFIKSALDFKVEMQKLRSLNELRDLWSKTQLPYQFYNSDPFSNEYRQEVIRIYESLCSKPYSVTNELTSTLQSPDDFQLGYPWISKDLRIVAQELGKAVQAIKVIAEHNPNARTFCEFGSGWGNLAVPLARSGMDVTVVDIDSGFLARTHNELVPINIKINSVHADFCTATELLKGQLFDAIIFSSSFHHCLDFLSLLEKIRDNMLSPSGSIYFFAEPVYEQLSFPWGIRYDGESLWAVTCNSWLELGFREDFFKSIFARLSLSISGFEDNSGLCGKYWIAKKKSNEFN